MVASDQVVFYGNSMFLAGIRAELQRLTSLKLTTVEVGSRDAAALVSSCNPLVVLFDLAADQPGFVASLLYKHPGLLLIGIDPSSDHLLVLSCHVAVAPSMADLVELISQNVSPMADEGVAG